MTPIGTALRRTVLLALLALGAGAALSWWRNQTTTPTPAQTPRWPDWPERADATDNSGATAATATPAAAASDVAEPAWLPANEDGSTPAGHPVKVKESSGIFHVPGGRFYDRTKPDRCYPTAAAAEADGYRRSKT
jgi:acetyl esterase/lipase